MCGAVLSGGSIQSAIVINAFTDRTVGNYGSNAE
jgi:hypothetical protein